MGVGVTEASELGEAVSVDGTDAVALADGELAPVGEVDGTGALAGAGALAAVGRTQGELVGVGHVIAGVAVADGVDVIPPSLRCGEGNGRRDEGGGCWTAGPGRAGPAGWRPPDEASVTFAIAVAAPLSTATAQSPPATTARRRRCRRWRPRAIIRVTSTWAPAAKSGSARRPERLAQRPGVKVVHRCLPPIGCVSPKSSAASSARTRSLASARELVDFTVPTVMPRSLATAASGWSNR